jgi:predicted AAA+ superfamily ATPase
MQIFSRLLKLPDITKQNVFLWGPRKVGKSSWLKMHLTDVIYIDLLKSDVLYEYTSRPSLLRERYQLNETGKDTVPKPIIIDEIQKCPALLDEVHWLIENTPRRFVLTGSSARKLRRAHANLLGGRAWRREMRPLTSKEISITPNYGELDIDRAVIQGLIPSHYLAENWKEELKGYVSDYLIEEIAQESVVRNLPAFSDFLRVASLTNAELLNYTNVSREVGVSAKVIRGYFEILEDTLLGFRISPWPKSPNRRLIETEKFYLFDVGVCNYLARRTPRYGTPEFGKSFEHFILMELIAYKAYVSPESEIRFWRTATQQEVDFIINDKELAVEIKSSARSDLSDCRHLTALSEDGPVKQRVLVTFDTEPKSFYDKFGLIEVVPWRDFLRRLWDGGWY